ncbi:two-component system sensor histidine kinase CreC [Cognatilysobacter bugurensis]|uniref:histidine kinase n=1 Tax=Cognatilysobacter bugurensis TaxID=543356 RepID=A0A918W888_9GAMM|nr:two-component system sensor histidine kinase CreC [Lysobacter bugurensis]GHA80218.1 two-component sensor histidine kinase [Lysobacter bugurensis]
MRIGLRIFLGYFAIVALAGLLLSQVFLAQVKPGVRQAMEDTLVDMANVLAELAADDLQAGRIADGHFAQAVRSLRGRDPGAAIWGFEKRTATYRIYVADARGIVVYDSTGRDVGADYSRWNDVYLTLRGRYGARSTAADPRDPDSSVMHVAAPIRDAAGRIVGVLTVAKPNRVIAPFIERSQTIVLRWGAVLLGVALLVGLLAAWWLSRQLGLLRRYAQAVSAGERASLPRTAGEFDELGRALETMRTQLEGKQYVEQYVHALTHEMKSPLAAIRASAELLEQPLPADDREPFAEAIRTQSERLTLMIDKMLALAAVEHRQRLDDVHAVRVAELLDEVTRDAQARLQGRGQRLEVHFDDAELQVAGDGFLLRQALVNLVENASDFAPASSAIELHAERDGEVAQLCVLDRGPGVPDYATPRVFERFYSLPRPDGGSRSSGLGLCFVAEVATLHGGSTALDNRNGGGAAATLRVPLAR